MMPNQTWRMILSADVSKYLKQCKFFQPLNTFEKIFLVAGEERGLLFRKHSVKDSKIQTFSIQRDVIMDGWILIFLHSVTKTQ